jgi:serine/threonine protein kinase
MDALQKLFICLDIAEAVNHIHSKGFIQKDLKIGNIYLDELMIPRVSNFGTNADISNDQVDPKDLYVRSPETIM